MIPGVVKVARILLLTAEAVWYYTRRIWQTVREKDILFLASALAFNGILTMIPLMLLSASALGILLNSSDLALQKLHAVLDTIFPSQPFATSIKDSLLTVVADMIAYRTSLGLVGVVVLIWTGTSLFDSLRSVLHAIYGIRRKRGLLTSFLHDVGFVVLVFVLLLATNIALWLWSLAQRIARGIPALATADFDWLNATTPTIIIILLTAIMFYVVYRFIPDTRPPRRAGIISTLTTTLVWVVSGKLFAVYLSSFSAISKIYGAYAFILVLLIWIYYSSIIFVFGGIVGQVYWERRKLRESGTLERWV